MYIEVIDMRKGVDGLSGLVRNGLQKDPLSGDVFIFLNRRRNQIKLLLWEGDGFALYYKRLEKGNYEIPSFEHKNEAEIHSRELVLILQGVVLKSVKRTDRYTHPPA
jgi:transposase